MDSVVADLQSRVAQLAAVDRVEVVEGILDSLDHIDPQVALLWAAEAQDRLASWGRGEIAEISASEVLREG
jgi:hypothetical protein